MLSGPDDKNSSLLPGIPAEGRLTFTSSPGAEWHVRPPRGPIERMTLLLSFAAVYAFRSGSVRSGHSTCSASRKSAACSGTSVANDDQLGAVTPYRWKDVPQLRDLLAAENSSEVADEGEDNRLLLPEIAEAYGGPSRVEHFDVA